MQATGSVRVLQRQSAVMIVVSAIYIGAATVLSRSLGIIGLIFANSINMALRIAFSLWAIGSDPVSRPALRQALPPVRALLCLAAACAAVLASEQLLGVASGTARAVVLQIGHGGAWLLGVLMVLYLLRRRGEL